MSYGKKLGEIDANFSARISDLEQKAAGMAQSFYANYATDKAYRPWHTPKDIGDLLDVPALHTPVWTRKSLNERYSEKILPSSASDPPGTCADIIATKWQIDFMAAEERAFRLRHASYARCVSLMHGRLNKHGAASDNIFFDLKQSAENKLNEAGELIDKAKQEYAKRVAADYI
ncbi:hypothetical protein EBZ39_02740 [bacterium]|nr:hypothetical protein [bacterium]